VPPPLRGAVMIDLHVMWHRIISEQKLSLTFNEYDNLSYAANAFRKTYVNRYEGTNAYGGCPPSARCVDDLVNYVEILRERKR